jgi:predicted membrane-bound spermidine synthase
MKQRVIINIAVLLGGAVLMALEVAGFRIIGRTFGSALRETTTVIAVFLVAMTAGYWLGGRIGDRRPRLDTLALVMLIASATLLLIPQLDALLSGRISSTANLSVHAFLATAALFAIPTVALATISPIAIRLQSHDTEHSGRVAGTISALSTIGSVIGSVVTAFFLIDWLGSINQTVLLLGIISAAVALLVTAVATRDGARSFLERCIAPCSALLVMVGCFPLLSSRTVMPPGKHGTQVVFERDSAYHHVRVIDRAGGERDLYIDATLQSRLYRGDEHERGLVYPEHIHVARLLRPDTRRALFIGLGGGTITKQFVKYYDDTQVDAVEIDPLIAQAAAEYFGVKPAPRLNVAVADRPLRPDQR